MNAMLNADNEIFEEKLKALIGCLNTDLELCRRESCAFEEQATFMRYEGAPLLARVLTFYSSVKARNAATLAVWIVTLGGSPSGVHRKAARAGDVLSMLEMNRVGKEVAIVRYAERLEQSEQLKLHELSRELRELLAAEFIQLAELKAMAVNADGISGVPAGGLDRFRSAWNNSGRCDVIRVSEQ